MQLFSVAWTREMLRFKSGQNAPPFQTHGLHNNVVGIHQMVAVCLHFYIGKGHEHPPFRANPEQGDIGVAIGTDEVAYLVLNIIALLITPHLYVVVVARVLDACEFVLKGSRSSRAT